VRYYLISYASFAFFWSCLPLSKVWLEAADGMKEVIV
jgi:hypothetical protein